MKKLLTSIIILLIVAMGLIPIAYAEVATSSTALLFKSNISAKDRTVSVKVSLGTIENITGDEIAGFQANLKYEDDILIYDTIVSATGWKASYGESTGVVLIESEDGTKLSNNMQMAEIKFKIKEGVETLDSDIELKDIVLTLDEKEIKITPDFQNLNVKLTKEEQTEEQKEEEKPEEKQPTPGTESIGEESKAQEVTKKAEEAQKNAETTVKATDDKTTAAKVLPKTGVYKTMAIITIIALLALVCGIRYKSIKIK